MSRGGDFLPVSGDFDNNGFDDIVWYTPGAGGDLVYFGAGGRDVWVTRSISVSGTYDLVVGDVDGDSKDDLVFYSEAGTDFVWWGSSATTFGPTGEKVVVMGSGLEPAAGDFDGDGRDDLLLYSRLGSDTVWWGASRTAFGTDAAQKGLASDPVVSTYAYGSDGLRKAKVVDGSTTSFTWDRSGGMPLLLSQHVGSSVTRVVYGPGGTPIYQANPDGTVSYYHQDRLGSTRLTTGSTGTAATTHAYDAYGVETASTGTAAKPLLGYAGQYTDTETGFQYLRARYYDPTTGQFLTRDPLNNLTEDPYAYATTNPTNNTDPLGLFSLGDAWDATGGKVVSGASNFVENPGSFVQRNRHTIIDVSTGVAAVSACATVVGCLAVAGGGVAAHLLSDRAFDDDRRISVSEAVFRSTSATFIGGVNGRVMRQGSLVAAGGFPPGASFVPRMLQRNVGLGVPRWVAGTWYSGSAGARWSLHDGIFGC